MHGPFAIHRGNKLNTETPVINCAQCGEATPKTSPRKKFCSQRCKDQGKPSAQGLTCCVCGKRMARGATSRPQGEARHNRCTPLPSKATGHPKTCKCEHCKTIISAYSIAYREWYSAQHGVNPSTPARRKRRQEGAYQYSEGVPGTVRARVYERDGGTCQICGYPTEQGGGSNSDTYPSVDHITPRSQGGTHTIDNLRTVHRRCNSLRADNKRTDADVRAIVLGLTA